ncbi:hypothetical protein F4604DRAFT_1674658 [Suillus subluteus]|nr:hypothetical protein F4604DRAFT_1674658 [Suillus subluteus]
MAYSPETQESVLKRLQLPKVIDFDGLEGYWVHEEIITRLQVISELESLQTFLMMVTIKLVLNVIINAAIAYAAALPPQCAQFAASPTSTSPTSVPSASSSSSDTSAGDAFLSAPKYIGLRPVLTVAVSLVQGAITTLVEICESEGLWTIRFSLGCQEHLWWTGIALALIASLGCMILSFLAGNNSDSLGIILLASASSLAVFRYAWPAWRNPHYRSNRWAAWTGPSRTGIDAALVPFVKGDDPWPILSKEVPVMKQHPVDIRLFRSRLIADDPTDILKAKRRIINSGMSGQQPVEEEKSLKVVERPDNRTGLYEPSVCLAHGILGRDKGLAPKTFILGLDITKVLHSYFKEEMEAAYGSLPKNYINAATELALLLADSSHALVADWLAARMEHQDIALNNQVAPTANDAEADEDLQTYSDGSAVDGGVGGAAVLMRGGEVVKEKRFHLGSDREHTVYEGEIVGMILAVELLREERGGGTMALGVDNQAAISATNAFLALNVLAPRLDQ